MRVCLFKGYYLILFSVPLTCRAYVTFIKCVCLNRFILFPFRSLVILLCCLSRATFTVYFIVFSQSRDSFFSPLYIRYLLYFPIVGSFSAFYIIRCPIYKPTPSLIFFPMFYLSPPSPSFPSTFCRPCTLSFPSPRILYTFCIPSRVLRMFTRTSRPFLSPH